MKRIGIDVGGTNTDAVLLDGDVILSSIKTATTPDVMSGITAALGHILADRPQDVPGIRAVMIGTTHFTNAVIARDELAPVAVIRIGQPAAYSIPPLTGWPEDLRARVEGAVFAVRGGHELDSRPIVPFDRDEMIRIAIRIRESGLGAAAVTSVFSPVNRSCEEEAAAILAEHAPGVFVTLSSELGQIGLLERENATILNSALHDLAVRTVAAFEAAVTQAGIGVPVYLTQNDGTIINAEIARRFPVLCFASGPTNSMRGARLLSGLENAIVLDVGGTTTDAGVLISGFPREANAHVDIGGVATSFRMPDVMAFALGGGTLVHADGARVGPDSLGYRVGTKALSAGGDTLCLTDVMVARGRMDFGDKAHLSGLPPEMLDRVESWISRALAELVDRMKTSAADVPVIAVGGGAALVPDHLPGVSRVIKVPNAGVANAVGAAMAQVSGEIDRIFREPSREIAIAKAEEEARARAIEAGAHPETLKVVDLEDTPMSYVRGNPLRVRLRVIGDLRL